MRPQTSLRRFKQPLVLGLLLLTLTGCATASVKVRTQYVPVETHKDVCVYEIEDSFKEPVYLSVNDLPPVETDDDVELLAKTALDDITNQDIAFENLVDEVDSVEEKCAAAKAAAELTRQETLDSIDELNKLEP